MAQTSILRLLFAFVEQLACMLELHRLRSAESCFDFQARLKLKFLGIFEGFGSTQEGHPIILVLIDQSNPAGYLNDCSHGFITSLHI